MVALVWRWEFHTCTATICIDVTIARLQTLTAGLHGYDAAHTKTATVTLAPGPHALRLDYFQGAGNVGLTLLMSTGTAAAAQPISPSALSHSAVRRPKIGLWY